MPTEDDFNDAMLKAQAQRGRPVELVWQAGADDYFLNVSWVSDTDPVWTLYKTKAIEKNALLQHVSADVGLVHKLCLASCTSESPDESILKFYDQ
jgi:hypothetical protein